MARAALNWSLQQLADAAGVHRNTISNFETGKFAGDPERLAALRAALEAAGVIFVQENGEGPGVRLRKAAPAPDEIAAKIERLDAKAAALDVSGPASPEKAMNTMDKALAKGPAKGLRKKLAKAKGN